ncbi:MAG: hypothetical protein ACK5O3_06125 [Burkholderiales bacterium]
MDSTLRSNPQFGPQRLPSLMGAFLLLLYALGLAFGFELSSHWLGHLNAHGHAHLHPHGHPFVDARAWLCVPNAADTLSNLPFALLALWGARLQALRGRALPAASRAALAVLWLGLFLTALGSGLYHWLPTPVTLMADRLGMAVAFAGALALSTAGLLSQAAAWRALALLLPAAALAACLPLQGNLLPWLVVQFGGVLWLLLAAFGPRQPDALAVRWGWVVAAYAVAKVFEVNDAAVFYATADWGVLQVSGHTLKHFVAAAAVLPVLLALQKLPRQ